MAMPDEVAQLRALMEYEAARTAPPESWPVTPDVPAGRYTDERFFELEMNYLWRKSWLLAAHLDELPDPGCYRLWDQLGEPIVITHTETGEIKAFYNTCRHRGAPVVMQEFGQSRRLTCAYHGWSYSHDGELMGLRDPEDFHSLDKGQRGLKPVRCERYGKLIFVNLDPEALSLLEWLGPIADEWREFRFDTCRLAARHSFELDCNWKIAMEANTEVYHVRSIHPTTVAPILDDRRNVNTLYHHGHGRMVAPTPTGKSNMDAVPMDTSIPEIESVGELARTGIQSYGLFPNLVAPLSQYALPPLLFWPRGIRKSVLETWTIAPEWGNAPAPDMWTLNQGEELCQVLQEDMQFGLKIQKSMESPAFEGVPLSYQEARIYHWNEAADRIIGPENIPKELRVAQVIGEEWIWPNDPRRAHI
ncbi:MAG: SRPBCC family protein [Pseudomonadota bacterium]